MKTLADTLGVTDPTLLSAVVTASEQEDFLDITDSKIFCQRILESKEFRQYITKGITTGTIPSAVMIRILDHAWGKPPERIEHTGKDGQPIVTEVRRIVVRSQEHLDDEQKATAKYSTH